MKKKKKFDVTDLYFPLTLCFSIAMCILDFFLTYIW